MVLRIIPARAGQTSRRSRPARTCPDHPRACGANAVTIGVDVSDTGSSPRVRGKLVVSSSAVGEARIIPARAGQTRPFVFSPNSVTDHPRACGANRSMKAL